MNSDLKHIDFKQDFFEANGVKYIIRDTLCINRFIEFEKLQTHVGFGKDFKGIYSDLEASINLANKGKGVEAWNTIYNLKEGIGYKLEERTYPALLLCSLFIVTEDEDISVFDERLAKKKIEDWNKEKYDVRDFFRLAVSLVEGFIPVLDEISQTISAQEVMEKLSLTESS